ncbi:MAG: S8 family serine peptidase [Defluviitaleaceae bacterium]|nr:S8 family serine peptidase [Defluviitaleaceae bacterium]
MLAEQDINRPGEGVRVGVLDTGIDYFHPVFAQSFDETLGRQRGTNFIPDVVVGGPAPVLGGATNPNNIMERLPGQPGFTGIGATSHGTHVAGSIIAIAPYATLYHYRVLSGSTPNAIIVAGIEAAHADGMDIVNMSLGANTPSPFGASNQAVHLGVLDGITFIISAGNNGAQNYMSIGNPGTASLAISVGSGQRGGLGRPGLDGQVYIDGVPIWSRLDGLNFGFDAESLSSITQYTFLGNRAGTQTPAEGTPAFDAYIAQIRNRLGGDLTGQLAVIERGLGTGTMRAIAQELNAAAWFMIDDRAPEDPTSLENASLASGGISGQNHSPSFIVRQAYRSVFGAAYSTGVVNFEYAGNKTYTPLPDNISVFSSRGPVQGTLHLKPDIVGPGDRIVSALPSFVIDPTVAPGPNAVHHYSFGTSSGTSMSAPAVSGVAALLLHANPDMPPAEVRARMMNTAVPLTGTPSAIIQATNGGDFYSVFNVGAGFVNPVGMFEIGNTFATTETYVPIAGDNAGNATWVYGQMSSLSFGSIRSDASEQKTVTFHNSTGTWTPNVQFNGNSVGVTLDVVNTTQNTVTFEMRFAENAVENAYYEGNIIFTNADQQITMPFAAFYQGEPVERFELNHDYTGVRRPIVSGHVRWTADDPEIRHIPAPPLNISVSNTATARIHIIDTMAQTGTHPFALYARLPNGAFVQMGSHPALPVNGTVNLNNFISINTQAGLLPDGIYETYVRIGSGPEEFFGPFGTHNRFIVTSEEPTIIFDEEVFTFEEEDTSMMITGRIQSAGHDLAVQHDVRSLESPDWAFDYWYSLSSINFGAGWGNLVNGQTLTIDYETGEFIFGFNFPENFQGATYYLRTVEGFGIGHGPNPFFGANITAATPFVVAPAGEEIVDGRVVTFVAGENGTMTARDITRNVTVESGDLVPAGNDIVFIGHPAPGFEVADWTLAFGAQTASADAFAQNDVVVPLPTFTIRNIAFDHHVTVTFRPEEVEDDQLRIYLNTIGEGHLYMVIEEDGENVNLSLEGKEYIYVPYDTPIEFLAAPATGWRWNGGWEIEFGVNNDSLNNATNVNEILNGFTITAVPSTLGIDYAILTVPFVLVGGGGQPDAPQRPTTPEQPVDVPSIDAEQPADVPTIIVPPAQNPGRPVNRPPASTQPTEDLPTLNTEQPSFGIEMLPVLPPSTPILIEAPNQGSSRR